MNLGTPQSLKDACRWICFHTNVEGWEVATHGGTMVLVAYEGTVYALTAKHNRHDFRWGDLIIGKSRVCNEVVGPRGICYASVGVGRADQSDLLDIAIILLADDVRPDYFAGAIYDLDREPVCASHLDDDLTIYGVVSSESEIDERDIRATFGELGFVDIGPNSHDIVLREAKGQWLESQVTNLAGISGCPVYNASQGGLCGMVLRGGVATTGIATIHYIEMRDIAVLLDSVHQQKSSGLYTKIVAHPITENR